MGSFFVGVENAKYTSKNPWFNHVSAEYDLTVDALKTFSGRKGPMFAAEYTINASTGEGANRQGTKAVQLIPGRMDTALKNVKGLIGALLGVDPNTVTQKMCDNAVAENNPCKGIRVLASTLPITTKDGKPFTVIQYQTHPVSAASKKVA